MVFALLCAVCAILLRKTDGSHTSRPFFRCKLDVRENAFCPKYPPSAATSFVSFLQEKKSFPLLFFLEEKKQKKISSRICFCASLYILRYPVAQNGRLTYEPSVFSFQAGCAGNRLLSEIFPLGRFVFCFFSSRKEIVPLLFFLEEKKSSPLEEKKSFPPLVSPSHGAGVTAGAGLIVGSSCARYASTISSTDSSFRMMEISMRRLRVRPASVAFVSTGRVAP